ncbi:uncharacterized protein [Rutidosis leptorrhynchoides]|uniref:uncharacterized protein n=1 Tax=Rutidosis leptorrhynchoides TaxID=125765 RepID=UPI003A991E71
MPSNDGNEYTQLVDRLKSYSNIPEDLISSLLKYNSTIDQSSQQNMFSKPIPWIGLYIASASMLCILAMVADLIHGVRNRKLWFANKYFRLNAASLSVIAVAMKLPVDLSSIMPGVVDKNVKLVSMAFMSTMMANLLTSLATMTNKELVANIIGLGILVITMVVNVCIQIGTGLLPHSHYDQHSKATHSYSDTIQQSFKSFKSIGIYAPNFVVILLLLFVIHTCSALAIITCKQILESKYQEVHESSLMDERQGPLHVEKLKRQVCKYWTMAETGSPQFMTACLPTSSASGVICLFSCFLTISLMLKTKNYLRDYKSDYKWSMVVILIVQSSGVLLGSISPLCRCFTPLRFKFSENWSGNYILPDKEESYWIKKLNDLKQSSTAYPFHSRKYKIVIQNLKIAILNICIIVQMLVVLVCRLLVFFQTFVVFIISICVFLMEWRMHKRSVSLSTVTMNEPDQVEENDDLTKYVLLLQDDIKLRETTLKRISQSLNRFIQKVQKKQPDHLKMLINESSGFEGVGNYDNHHIPSLLTTEYHSSWSLSLVTLTTIAISIPYIQKKKVDRLLRGVSEGLAYVALVEENLNATDDYVSIKKAARTLWWQVVQDSNGSPSVEEYSYKGGQKYRYLHAYFCQFNISYHRNDHTFVQH